MIQVINTPCCGDVELDLKVLDHMKKGKLVVNCPSCNDVLVLHIRIALSVTKMEMPKPQLEVHDGGHS